MLDLRRQYVGLREEILAAIARVCDSQTFILGPEVEALERDIAAFTGSAHAVGCSSGTEALWLALMSTGAGVGSSVITTPFSFLASASSIARTGARPVFADIHPGTLNLDPAKVAEVLTVNSAHDACAILPVHLYGQCANMDEFLRIGKEHSLPVIEDAAQAIGAAWSGRPAGSMGAAAAFSFYPTKNLSAYGDAGMVTTNSPERAEHMGRLRNHGSPRRYYHDELGWNGRLDAIQAAVLRVKLPHVQEWNEARRRHAGCYDRLLAAAGLTGGKAAPLRILERAPQATHIFHQYVVCARDRDALRQHLTDRKIGSEVYYPVPLHLQACFAYLGHREGDFPEAERAAKEVLALPMFPELRDEEIARVVAAIGDFYS